jgi:hypothetical protein
MFKGCIGFLHLKELIIEDLLPEGLGTGFGGELADGLKGVIASFAFPPSVI